VSAFSNYLENKVMDHVFGGVNYTAPSTLYLALYTSNPDEGNTGTEVSGGSYARQTIAFTVTNNLASNTSAIEFPVATGTWGTITHIGVMDSLTTGNLLAYAQLTASKAVSAGDALRFPVGDIDITLD
jgi:hypothetical protein